MRQPSGELFDVVDKNGNPTGETKDKNDIHAGSELHRDTHVWITDGQHLLQQYRDKSKKIMPGVWDVSASGHVDAGESYLATARRELGEELGVDLPAKRFVPFGITRGDELIRSEGWRHRTIGENFVVVERNLALGGLTLEKGKVAGARWYAIDQLEADLRSPNTARQHAPHSREMWALGIAAMRKAAGRG